MVGVPGRSKACLPCKKRRVTCDLQQPECSRCARAGRPCEYARGCIFVLNDKGSHKTQYRCPRDAPVVPSDLDTGDFADSDRPRRHDRGQMNDQDLLSSTDQLLALYRPPPSGSLTHQALVSRALSEGKSFQATAFLAMFSNSVASDSTTPLLAAPLACYTSWLARRDQSPSLIDLSKQYYICGLRATQRALMDPQKALDDSTLLACHALTLYEALECPDDSIAGFHCHRDGIYRLTRMRGAKAHQEGIAHKLFVVSRLQGILYAFEQNRTSYLSSKEWTQVPFEKCSKTIFDELVDSFALGPEQSKRGAQIQLLPPHLLGPTVLDIVHKTLLIVQGLQKLYSKIEEAYPTPLYWERSCASTGVVPKDSINDDPDLVYPPAFCFRDADLACILTLYWSLMAIGFHGLKDLYAVLDEIGIPHEPLAIKWQDMARKVCQSVAYCTSPEALRCGPPRIGTQLSIVIGIMKANVHKGDCVAEYEFAVEAREQMGKKWLRLLRYLP